LAGNGKHKGMALPGGGASGKKVINKFSHGKSCDIRGLGWKLEVVPEGERGF